MIEELRKTSNEQRLIDTRTTKSRIRNKNKQTTNNISFYRQITYTISSDGQTKKHADIHKSLFIYKETDCKNMMRLIYSRMQILFCINYQKKGHVRLIFFLNFILADDTLILYL